MATKKPAPKAKAPKAPKVVEETTAPVEPEAVVATDEVTPAVVEEVTEDAPVDNSDAEPTAPVEPEAVVATDGDAEGDSDDDSDDSSDDDGSEDAEDDVKTPYAAFLIGGAQIYLRSRPTSNNRGLKKKAVPAGTTVLVKKRLHNGFSEVEHADATWYVVTNLTVPANG